jgi:hypothetical protein
MQKEATLNTVRRRFSSPCVLPLLVVTLACVGEACAARAKESGPGAAFLDKVEDYLRVQREALKTVPSLKETDSPDQIASREQLLAQAVKRARPDARPGDVFAPARGWFIRIIRSDWRHRPAAERAGLMSELPSTFRPRVNDTYPTTFPLVTFPPALLDQLPRLPEELEYRLLGPHLILRDVAANLIVDVLPDVLPTSGARGASAQ